MKPILLFAFFTLILFIHCTERKHNNNPSSIFIPGTGNLEYDKIWNQKTNQLLLLDYESYPQNPPQVISVKVIDYNTLKWNRLEINYDSLVRIAQ